MKVQNGQCNNTEDDVYVCVYDPYMRVVVSCNKDDAKRYLTYYRNVYKAKKVKAFSSYEEYMEAFNDNLKVRENNIRKQLFRRKHLNERN